MASTTGDVGTLDLEAAARDAQRLLEAAGHGDWELSLLFCDDAFIAPLNEQWRGKQGATDVLSFPQVEFDAPGEPVTPPVGPPLLGDIVISVQTAVRQAEGLGHDGSLELRVLLAHGIAHLLGHTHAEAADRAAMNALETELLAAVDIDGHGLIARADAGG